MGGGSGLADVACAVAWCIADGIFCYSGLLNLHRSQAGEDIPEDLMRDAVLVVDASLF